MKPAWEMEPTKLFRFETAIYVVEADTILEQGGDIRAKPVAEFDQKRGWRKVDRHSNRFNGYTKVEPGEMFITFDEATEQEQITWLAL